MVKFFDLKFALNKHLYKKSEDLSPVKTLSVLVPRVLLVLNLQLKFSHLDSKPVIGFPQ